MNIPKTERRSLWDLTAASGLPQSRFIADGADRLLLADLATARSPDPTHDLFRDRSVLISCRRQLPAVTTLLALDGVARGVSCFVPPDLAPAHLPTVIAEAAVDLIVSDGTGPVAGQIAGMDGVAPQ